MIARPAVFALVAITALVAFSAGLSAYRAQRPEPTPPPDTRPALPLHMRGINLPTWEPNGYDGDGVRASIRQARGLGANWVALTPTWYASTRESCDLGPDPEKTVTDSGLYQLAVELDRLGVRVLLKPHVDVRDGAPRNELRPRDEACFFAAYRRMIFHYAEIAQLAGVDLFAIGTELSSLSGPRDAVYWRELAAGVRRQFPGPLTYAANWGMDEQAEFRQINWWDAVDYVGVDAFFPLAASDTAEVDFSQAWRHFPIGKRAASWIEDVHSVSRRFNRRVILTELGYRSAAGSARMPWDSSSRAPVDLELQARLFEAARASWEREFWLEGVFIWAWSTDPNAGGTADAGYTPQGKPAAGEVRRWFERE